MRSADSILKMHLKRLVASLCTNRWGTLQRAPPHLQVDLRQRGRVGTREGGREGGKTGGRGTEEGRENRGGGEGREGRGGMEWRGEERACRGKRGNEGRGISPRCYF